ncbi:MAG: hypothetical protein AAF532_07070 [Planctomycetota bacterium]
MRDELVKLMRAEPFEPFEVAMSSGETFVVRHPELAAAGSNRLLVIDPDRGREFSLRYLHMAGVAAASLFDIDFKSDED